MEYSLFDITLLFFAYSFLGWIAETGVATIKEKDFRNRGFVSGPFCFIYGLCGVVLTVFLQDLRKQPVFLFFGSMIIATVLEWFAGKGLERMKQKKWWDYSAKKWNLDGYICFQYSLLWGILGFAAVQYGNDFLLGLFRLMPDIMRKIVVWGLAIIGLTDGLVSLMTIYHLEIKVPLLLGWNRRLQQWTLQFGTKVADHIDRRMGRVYALTTPEPAAEKGIEQLGAAQVFWLFLTGALLGDIVETVFCRITAGVWMSRSSLVWGPFSIVWGLAIALATILLHRDRDKSDRYIFLFGTFLGGAYEYICSVFTEIVFGKVFWDYSAIPFNLGGRINLLYCFFWGIAAVVWIKLLYPKMARLMGIILKKTGRWLTLLLMMFMIVNISVSVLALVRYDMRVNGKEADSGWEYVIDSRFDDARMERIYPNAKQR